MKIYTKGGDKGTTSLVGGKRVPKNHPRVEAYGDLDELISFIGIIISDTDIDSVKANLRKIQENLMLVSAHFASDGSSKSLKEISEDDIIFLENLQCKIINLKQLWNRKSIPMKRHIIQR